MHNLTPEQRKKLEEEALRYDESKNSTALKYAFIDGAEAYARILSEGSKSDEEAAYEWINSSSHDCNNEYCQESGCIGINAFLAGCALYRPLVEEMISMLTNLRFNLYEEYQFDYPNDGYEDLIARAEALLLSTKEGNE